MSESPYEELDPLRVEQMLANAWSETGRLLANVVQRNLTSSEKGGEQMRMHEQLASRMSEVEGQMEVYSASVARMQRLLDLAAERAQEIEHAAQVEAARLRVETQQHVEAVLSDLDSKIEQKKDALRQLSMLEFGMVQRAERVGVPPEEQALAAGTLPAHEEAIPEAEIGGPG